VFISSQSEIQSKSVSIFFKNSSNSILVNSHKLLESFGKMSIISGIQSQSESLLSGFVHLFCSSLFFKKSSSLSSNVSNIQLSSLSFLFTSNTLKYFSSYISINQSLSESIGFFFKLVGFQFKSHSLAQVISTQSKIQSQSVSLLFGSVQ
jgi:hypothetical protein